MRLCWALGLWAVGWGRHIAGADFYYTCINPLQNLYEFELWLYRDCTDPEGAEYDNPITVYIFRGDGSLYQTQTVYLSQSAPWNPQGVNACFLERPGTCLEEGVYTFTLTLPPRADGYYVGWARCCRNAAISNLADPLNMGITYLARIPPARRATCNSSPRFVQRPPFFLCAGHDFYFNHAATDADGDSLVYQIVPAYHSLNTQGQGAVNPIQGGSPAVGTHNPMGPPPYQTVSYASGYSYLQPFGLNGVCEIDSLTGLLHLRAMNPGLYVVAIAVLEFRNGEFLGETRRDMQFYVAPCRELTAPPLISYDFGSLPHQGDTLLLEAAQTACWYFSIRDTQPPTPPAILSYTLSPSSLYASSNGTNPLLIEVCFRPACEDTGRVLPLGVKGYKTEICGTTWSQDTIWIAVLAPPPRSISGTLFPPALPQSQGIYLLPLDSTACVRFEVVATPSEPPLQISYEASMPSASLSLSTAWRGDTLEGELCYTGRCEALVQPLALLLQARAPTPCPPEPVWQETIQFLVQLPSNPPPTIEFLELDTLSLRPAEQACVRVRITDSLPASQHTLYVKSSPPLLQVLSQQPPRGSGSWESEICFVPSCSAIDSILLLIAEVRDSISCAELHRRRDTLVLMIQSRPTYPLALYVPGWRLDSPFQPVFRQTYCFEVTARDTGRNGGTYAIQVTSPALPLHLSPSFQAGDSIKREVCFEVPCFLSPDSVYPLFIRATNEPFCAAVPPPTIDTIWIRPRHPATNRPPSLWRDQPTPWRLTPSEERVCYTVRVIDPDSFALLSYEGVGESFSPDFYAGSHFSLTAEGENPLFLQACASINCYAQGQRYPAIICIRDTTHCDPSQHWHICDTLWIETNFCHGLAPNVFTPNGDGINDLFQPYLLAGVERWRLLIWDRWGQSVFQGEWNRPWDGETPRGSAPEGVYYYVLEFLLLSGKGPPLRFERAGHVSLLR